ncbi:MAG: PLP-dependent transferase [Verrucomicrobiales bacterium]|nr:PLP-dependent transferase [Verrucomicrobiales bacterium]MCP5527654.1 PLP-dependent transferase [Verrucomicrobiales bacterium]
MTDHALFHSPLWQAGSLGESIPDSPHAISMALPRWDDVVGYEEKAPATLSRLKTGYPRFVIHPLVREIARRLSPERPCLPFPSRSVAADAASFVQAQSGAATTIVADGGLFGLQTDAGGVAALQAYWQHAGWIVSSRQAAAWLAGRGESPEAGEVRQALRRQLAGFYDCAEADVFLMPSGMAAQAAALRAVLERRPGRATVQLGFPYVDTLKLQQRFGRQAHLLHDLESAPADLRRLLEAGELAACFGEIPGNPLLGSVDLREITPQLRQHGVPFVADDVVATPFNIDLRDHADLIATSLTKFVAGSGAVMGGALICPPGSPHHAGLRAIIRRHHEELLWGADAAAIELGARGFPERMQQHNANGLAIAERLRTHPAIERVHYPKWESGEAYEVVRRPQGGWGALITFLPRDAARTSADIYDRLEVCKGPSLGTVFTLACPFTLLAHFHELEWAESCGVSRRLIRLSIGLEPVDELWPRIERALPASA